MSDFSQSEENYIKSIYYLQQAGEDAVGTNDIANYLQTKASSVTDMIKRLSDKDIISYQKYQGCELTKKGREVALEIIRKHRLWETFLVEKLHFGWDEVHEIAEQLEHINSKILTNRLDSFLGFPEFDPHGDPIPTQDGKINYREEATLLKDLEENVLAVVVGVTDSSVLFLQYLDKHKINLGATVKVVERFAFDDSAEVNINDQKINLSSVALSKIKVQSIKR